MIKAENKKLKAEVEELTTQLTTNKLEQYELDNYRQLLDLDAKYPSYPKVAASVIAKDSGNWFSTFTIDKGKKEWSGRRHECACGKRTCRYCYRCW